METPKSYQIKTLSQKLANWYHQNKRDLPWRKQTDPYPIWVSEVMLQQTTVEAVLPYYRRFLSRFKTVKSLAKADEEEVLSLWSGLGYYTRAKNLHLASKMLLENFPKSYKELRKLPGFGPYTARAVSSLAFEEKVGVVDANVIRVLSRFCGFKAVWWSDAGKNQLQTFWDQWIGLSGQKSSVMNQGLMELGSRVCKVRNPDCAACPLKILCYAKNNNKVQNLPLKKPKRKKEIWLWEPQVTLRKNKIAFIKNKALPVLKERLVFPGPAGLKKIAPKTLVFRIILHTM